MERYSTLWGTDPSGTYRRLGSSQRLGNFLTQKIGAANIKDVVELTEKLVTGITVLPGYENETLINKPLAVVYAPLYLEKMAGMTKGMKGFCAMAVSGLEHRKDLDRETSFSHTWFFPRADMLAGGELNYLDMLMGSRLTTNQDVKLHREGALEINFERQPQKVEPTLVKKDLPFVIAAIDALYQKKNVVLVLENGVNFNTRSMELLTQIYAMMQPVMATETGFATYQTQKRILDLSEKTNVQIFVVPRGADLGELPASKFEILTLGGQLNLQRTPVAETLATWMKMDWKMRSRAMAHLFAGSADYANADQFVKLSREFLAQAQDLSSWLSDTSKHKSITTVAELQAEDKTATGWKLVPWAKEAFEKKIPELLKDSTLDVLNARNVAACYEYNGTDAELKERSVGQVDAAAVNRAVQQYKYGRTLASVNEGELCRLIWEKADLRVGVGYREQMAKRESQHKLEIQDKDAKIADQAKDFAEKEAGFLATLAEQKDSYEGRMKTQKEKLEAEKAAAVEQEKQNTAAVQAKLDSADQVHAEEVDKLNQKHASDVNELKNQHQTAMETLKTQAQQKVNELNGTVQNLRDDLTQAEADKQSLRTNLNQVNADKQSLQASLDRSTAEKQNLQSNLEKFKTRNQELESDMTRAAKELQQKDADLAEEKMRYDDLSKKYRQATGKEPTPPETGKKISLVIAACIAAAALLIGGLLGVLLGKLLSKEPVYEVKYSTSGQGTVALSANEAEAGDVIVIDVTPAEGWQLESIKDASDMTLTKNPEGKFAFVMPEDDAKITVTFTEIPVVKYAVQWSVNGQIGDAGEMAQVILSTTEAEAGTTVTATVRINEGWELGDISCKNGTVLESAGENQYTFVMPEQDETLVITVEEVYKEPNVFDENGNILWDVVQAEESWIQTVETDARNVKQALGEDKVDDKTWSVVAMLTSAETDPNYILLLQAAQEGADAKSLLKPGALVLDNGEYVVLIPASKTEEGAGAWNDAVKVGRKLMDLLSQDNELLTAAGYMLEDERVVDLHALMAEAGMDDGWWMTLNGLTLEEKDREDMQNLLGSSRTPILLVKLADKLDGVVFDYFDDPEAGDKLVGIAEGKNRKASHVEDFVLVLRQG